MKTTRIEMKTAMAVLLIVSGVVMCYLSFYTDPVGEISGSVLGYFGECLIWAGSVFGLVEYIDFKTKKK